jgi:hypothetical protein
MKLINQNFRFSIHVILAVLFCFAMTTSAIAGHIRQADYANTDEQYSSLSIADTSNWRADDQIGIPIRLLMVADSTTSEVDKCKANRGVDCEERFDTESGPAEEVDMQARREKMIDKCKANHGTDCEKEVDTELEAEQSGIVHTSPPAGVNRPIIRPRPRPKASP